jgi:hypothetical protein
MAFTKEELRNYRAEIEQALQIVAEKYNINIHAGNISYTENNFTCKLEVTKKEVNSLDYEQAEFNKNCFLFGFIPEDYKKTFAMNGKMFTITGFNLKAHKMPIHAVGNDGRGYKFASDTVKRLIAS